MSESTTYDYDATLALGSKVWFLHPERTPIRRDEIRIQIQNMNRYNGAVSVKNIDHECLTALLGRSYLDIAYCHLDLKKRWFDDIDIQVGYASIHDDHEIVTGDMVSGLKKHLPEYKKLEHSWETHFHTQQGMPLEYRNDIFVKKLDILSLVLEMRNAKHPSGPHAHLKYNVTIFPSMDDLAKHVLYELNNDEKWQLIEDMYLKGKLKLQELQNVRDNINPTSQK